MAREPRKGSTISLYCSPSDLDRWKAFAAARNMPTTTALKVLIGLGLRSLEAKPKADPALPYLETLLRLSAETVALTRMKTRGITPGEQAKFEQARRDGQEIYDEAMKRLRPAPKGGQ